MRAARLFAESLASKGYLSQTVRIRCDLFGSLGATGVGHGSGPAVLLGLEGEKPNEIDPAAVPGRLAQIRDTKRLAVLGRFPISFSEKRDIIFQDRFLPYHPNGMQFSAFDMEKQELESKTYFSIGGGLVVEENHQSVAREVGPYPFFSAAELLAICHEKNLSISDVVMENERSWRPEADVREALLHIWKVMQECIERGIHEDGFLPGGLHVPRRAPALYRKLTESPEAVLRDPLSIIDWVNLYALAVNEENASGGRVVTAPTNGAAGVIPAVLQYWTRFIASSQAEMEDGVIRFLLTAGAIGVLYQKNASISGADVGCQGEVGVACSMAAGALAELRGGTPNQVENAAEIGMEHNLGLTCDPVGGLVQIPCIERNAMASIKAINAARIAMRGDGKHFVSLDRVIKTMRETGADMNSKYKETSRGGLAVNVIVC